MSRLVLNWMTPPEREAIFRRAWERRIKAQKQMADLMGVLGQGAMSPAFRAQETLLHQAYRAALGYGWPSVIPFGSIPNHGGYPTQTVTPCPTCGRWT